VTHIRVKAWGAGGGGVFLEFGSTTYDMRGGVGGYTQADLELNSSSNYIVVVGQGGGWGVNLSAPRSYGFGGGFITSSSFPGEDNAGSGGGLSGLFQGTLDQSSALLIAGGGGGSSNDGAHTPPWVGANGNSTSSGGEADLLGQNGSDLGEGFGGGGGGYNGGSATFNPSSNAIAAGRGGSGYVTPLAENEVTLSTPDLSFDVRNDTDPDYVTGVGESGAIAPLVFGVLHRNGGDGLVVIQELCK
jgi:hypothetical protein